ncbi:hypothetical protein HLB23_16945 [Nocardia uniformis]|uniref:Uncharacterized protein n=1 Tax=Nocardia uniformis TaxID=53432 RepID=A0A849BYE3_9NOCA|nr:hypothetical protein [Nocardia uniformis]NNH71532.1 hypothetical protein [Nocardia uniformis]
MPLRPWTIPVLVTSLVLAATAVLILTAPTAHSAPPPAAPHSEIASSGDESR